MHPATAEEVTEFIAKFAYTPLERLSASTTLFGDLGIDGDDADELLAAFGKHFDVEMSSLDVARHFGPENTWPWTVICWFMLWSRSGTPEQKARLSPITIADLVRAAKCGKWEYN